MKTILIVGFLIIVSIAFTVAIFANKSTASYKMRNGKWVPDQSIKHLEMP